MEQSQAPHLWLGEKVDRMYRRPDSLPQHSRPRDYSEEYLLAEVSRRPGFREEFEEIDTFRQRLPAAERKYFPQSIHSLLSRWQEVLDRSRVYDPAPQDQSRAAKAAKGFILKAQNW